MSALPAVTPPPAADLEAAADQAIASPGGDSREAVKALIVACDFLEAQIAELRASVSSGYARGRLPRDRKEDRNG